MARPVPVHWVGGVDAFPAERPFLTGGRAMPALRFLPERTDFFVAFRAAATNAAEAAQLLTDLVTGQELVDQIVARLRDLEHRGDEITHNILTALARNLIAPISFEDIRALARQLDDITDAIEAVGQRLALY